MKRRGRGEGSVYRRADGTWAASISMGTGADGKRRRRFIYAPTKGELLERLRRMQHAADRGQLADAKGLTLGAFADMWLADVARTVTAGTLTYYAGHVRLHILPHLGGTKLEHVKPVVIRGLYTALQDGGVSAATTAKVGVTLGVMLAHAVSLGLIPHNPARDVRKPRGERFEGQAWTAEQMRQFLAAVVGDRFEAFFRLACETGMRQGELIGLWWQDVDFAGGAVNVRRSASAGEVKEPKTAAGRRRIPLSTGTLDALAERRRQALAEGHYGPDSPVFTNAVGQMVDPVNLLHRHFEPASKRAGVPRIRFHDVRHSVATLLLAGGVDLATVSARLGHASRATTVQFYAHATDAGQGQATAFMDRVISG